MFHKSGTESKNRLLRSRTTTRTYCYSPCTPRSSLPLWDRSKSGTLDPPPVSCALSIIREASKRTSRCLHQNNTEWSAWIDDANRWDRGVIHSVLAVPGGWSLALEILWFNSLYSIYSFNIPFLNLVFSQSCMLWHRITISGVSSFWSRWRHALTTSRNGTKLNDDYIESATGWYHLLDG